MNVRVTNRFRSPIKSRFLLCFFLTSFLGCTGSVPAPDVPCIQPEINIFEENRAGCNGRFYNIEIRVEGSLYTGWAYIPVEFADVRPGQYPAVYYLSGLRNAWTSFNGMDVPETLDQLFASSAAEPYVHIALPGIDFYDEFEDVFIHHLIPLCREELGIDRTGRRTALGGFSSGGDLSARMFFAYPSLFSCLGQHSAAIAKNDLPVWEERLADRRNLKDCSFYFSVGTEDPLLEVYELLRPVLDASGADYVYMTSPGGHNALYTESVFEDFVIWYGDSLTR